MVLMHQRDGVAEDDVYWHESIEGASIGSEVSLILTYSSKVGSGPRLHRHPYSETFVIRHGRALFTVGDEQLKAVGGQVLVVPAQTPHKFVIIGPEAMISTHIHASPTFITDWLE